MLLNVPANDVTILGVDPGSEGEACDNPPAAAFEGFRASKNRGK